MASKDVIGGIDLTGDEYTIKQSLIRNKYNVYDDEENLLLKAKQKLFKLKEEFPFTDSEGNTVFEIKAGGILDISGDYSIVDSESGEPVAILEKNFTFLTHKWKVRSPDDERLLARIESRGALFQLLRSAPVVSIVFAWVPHAYTIEDPDGGELGAIEGRFSLRDVYDVTIENTGDAPKEALVAASVAIDALEGN